MGRDGVVEIDIGLDGWCEWVVGSSCSCGGW